MQASHLLSHPGLPVLIASKILNMDVSGNKVKSLLGFFDIFSEETMT